MKLIIKEIIKQRGLTMQQVADSLGITRDTLTRTIYGNPTVESLSKIAEVIGCKVSEFFDSEPEQTSLTCPNCGARLRIIRDE